MGGGCKIVPITQVMSVCLPVEIPDRTKMFSSVPA
jgi:hypothetical protein